MEKGCERARGQTKSEEFYAERPRARCRVAAIGRLELRTSAVDGALEVWRDTMLCFRWFCSR